MPDTAVQITLNTSGGDAAAGEIKKASDAIQNVTRSSGALQEKFQERFQHIGLQLFAAQTLATVGLSGEVRQAVMLMNTAIQGAEAAAGISSGGLTLLITALAALAAIAVRVIEAHKDEAAVLEKVIDKNEKALQGYLDQAKAINEYVDSGHKLTPALEALLAADQAVSDDMKSGLIASQNQEIAVLEKQRAAIQESANLHATFAKILDTVKESLNQILAPFEKVVQYTQEFAKVLASVIPSMTTQVALTKEQQTAYDVLTQKIDELKTHHTQTFQKMAEDAKASYEKEEKAWEDMAKKISEGEKTQFDLINKLHKDIAKDQEEQQKKQTEATQKETAKQAQIVKQYAGIIGDSMGGAFSRMIVEGQTFTQAFQNVFQQMAEQIIQQIIKMIIEWEIFTALSGMGGPLGAIGGAGLSHMGFALGGSVVADRPTLAMFGEAGPERATFTPLSGGGGGGDSSSASGGDTYNIQLTMNANGVNDPQKMAKEVGLYLAQNIRGGGQINLSRT